MSVAPEMPADARHQAENARGFMPPDEGLALYQAAREAAELTSGPFLEVGSYCGKSSVYIGTAAKETSRLLFALDHHRGSEENQAGWEHHEPDLVDPEIGQMDTLPKFRRTIFNADLEGVVVALVGDSPAIGQVWSIDLALLFIDGGHGEEPAHLDYELWTPHVKPGGLLCIHDVFPNPVDGGRPPYEIYLRALKDGFSDVRSVGSLRVLKKD